MKKEQQVTAFWRLMALVALVALPAFPLMAQNEDWDQEEACPGWNNPTSFTTGSTIGSYSGQGGTVPSAYGGKVCPNVMTATVGFNLGPTRTPAQMESGVYRSTSCSSTSNSLASLPDRYKSYYINTNLTGYDPNTDNHLKYVPTHMNDLNPAGGGTPTNFQSSIRIGDACYDPQDGEYGAACLYYTMDVSTDNAMLYLYYAIVAEAPTHGMKGNPTFIIRVMKQNGSNWQQISDTMAYYITTTPQSNANYAPCDYMTAVTPIADYNVNGWHQAQGGSVYYKDWEKVIINLSNYLTKKVRIEVMIYDCEANYHYAYAYIAGECRPLGLQSSGCPAGADTNVTTLTAPKGLQKYAWYASEYGTVGNETYMYADDDIPFSTAYYTFRLISDTLPEISVRNGDTVYGNIYKVKANDFKVTYRPNAAHQRGINVRDSLGNIIDSIGNSQLFRCSMWSAIDPAKPFPSNLYVRVQNTKPTMEVKRQSFCGGDIELKNFSYVPGSQSLVKPDSTLWTVYSDTNFNASSQIIDTFFASDTVLHFDGATPRGLLVRTNIDETQITDAQLRAQTPHNSCYSEQQYIIRPLPNPVAQMHIDKTLLCDDENQTTVHDRTTGTVTHRRWEFTHGTDTAIRESSDDEFKDLPWTFTNSSQVVLTVNNQYYYLDTTATEDTVYCMNTDTGYVAVFANPQLEVTGDTIVCKGHKTDAHVEVLGAGNCTFRWFRPDDHSTAIATGPDLRVEPYASVATYDVEVTSEDGCTAWGSIRTYLVTPTLTMYNERSDDNRICPGDTVRLIGGNADHYTWSASPEDPSLAGQETNAIVKVNPAKTTTYTLVGHGAGDPGCDADELTQEIVVLPLPVPKVSVTPPLVDADDPKVVLRDVSTHSVGARWLFDDGTTASGTEIAHTFGEVAGADQVYVTLFPHNVLGCEVEYRFGIPVNIYTAWLPTAFTPGSEDANARFRLFANNEYEYFHIYIYNRRGELVFESTDPEFEWDGTSDGQPMPQAAYVYVCRYRKPGMNTLAEIHGTVTLIR